MHKHEDIPTVYLSIIIRRLASESTAIVRFPVDMSLVATKVLKFTQINVECISLIKLLLKKMAIHYILVLNLSYSNHAYGDIQYVNQ